MSNIIFTHKRMSTFGNKHEHITHLKYYHEHSRAVGFDTRENIIIWMETNHENRGWCQDGYGFVEVKVVHANPKYLRSVKDGRPTDNLLNLPDF